MANVTVENDEKEKYDLRLEIRGTGIPVYLQPVTIVGCVLVLTPLFFRILAALLRKRWRVGHAKRY